MAARSAPSVAARPRRANTIPYETPFRPFLPSTAYALAASRHMHEFGTTREQLAEVAVAAREWALLNPVGVGEEAAHRSRTCLSARPISYPFTVRDCCLITDGGGAIVMMSADRARSLAKPPVYVLGCGQAITHASISSMPDLTVTGARKFRRRRLSHGAACARRTSMCWRCTTRSPSTRSCSSRTSVSARRGKAGASSAVDVSGRKAACR